MRKTQRLDTGERIVFWTIALGLVLLIAEQARDLFVYPVPDSAQWFGDESWTVLTLRELARSGVARIPEALGSSLAVSNGFVNGCVWLSGLIYGIPLNFTRDHDPVLVGRIVTWLLSLLLLWVLYRTALLAGASRSFSLLGVLLLVASPVFVLASHSARLDLATSLAVAGCFYLFVWLYRQRMDRELSLGWYFAIPATVVLSITVYVHAPTLIALPAIYVLIKLGVLERKPRILAASAGLLLSLAFVGAAYYLSVSTFDLLGHGYNQYYNVANSLPIIHPFSWRVQKINTIDRFVQAWQVAWPLVGALLVTFLATAFKRIHLTDTQRFVLVLSGLELVGWMFFEGPAIYYEINGMAILALDVAVLVSAIRRSSTLRSPARSVAVPICTLVALLTIYGVVSAREDATFGERLVDGNRIAIQSILPAIRDSKPVVLTDEAGYHLLAQDTDIRLMTSHLLLFGSSSKPIPTILTESGVTYMLLHSARGWQSLFQPLAQSRGTLVSERTGWMTDLSRSPAEPNWQNLDTLRLYRFQ